MNKALQGLSFSRSKRRGKSSLGMVGVGALCLSLVALSTVSSTASGSAAVNGRFAAASTANLTPITLQLALVPPKMVFLGFYAAQDQGFFAANGLDVTIVPESTGVQAVRGMVSGHGFFAAGGSDGLATADAAGGNYRGIWNYASNDLSIVAQGDIKDVKGLKGKIIGITDKIGPSYTLPVLAMQTVGLKANDAKYAVLGGRPALVSALASGKINAAAFHVDDGLTVVKKDPSLHIIAQMSSLVPKWWYGTLLADADYAAANPGVVKSLLTALIQADRWMLANRQPTIDLGVKYTGFDPAVVADSYDILKANHNWSIGKEGFSHVSVNYTLRFYKNSGVIPKHSDINYNTIMDPSYLNDVLKKLGPGKY